jgi:hypothetical protein
MMRRGWFGQVCAHLSITGGGDPARSTATSPDRSRPTRPAPPGSRAAARRPFDDGVVVPCLRGHRRAVRLTKRLPEPAVVHVLYPMDGGLDKSAHIAVHASYPGRDTTPRNDLGLARPRASLRRTRAHLIRRTRPASAPARGLPVYIDRFLELYEGDPFLVRLLIEMARLSVFFAICMLDTGQDPPIRKPYAGAPRAQAGGVRLPRPAA